MKTNSKLSTLKIIKLFVVGLLIISAFWACDKDEISGNDYEIGRNDFTITIDADSREYIVQVPIDYDENIPTSVVFMLHAASGSGPQIYNSSGWKELGDDENIITVYPTSWSYCYTNSNTGQAFDQTLWNAFQNQFEFCTGEVPRDDIKFLREIISELNRILNIDSRRMYLAGFSSGAQMAYRCATEMSDVFAAIVESGASQYTDPAVTPLRNIPITFQIGNADNSWLDGEPAIPMVFFDSLLNNFITFKNIIYNHTTYFDFEPTYTVSGDTSIALIATFKGVPDIGNRNFQFIMVNGLEHKYPNGDNHPIMGAKQNWEWMKQFTAP